MMEKVPDNKIKSDRNYIDKMEIKSNTNISVSLHLVRSAVYFSTEKNPSYV